MTNFTRGPVPARTVKVPPLSPGQKRDLAEGEKNPVYIYNTYKNSYRVGSGWRTVIIRGVETNGSQNKDDWNDVSEATVIPGKVLVYGHQCKGSDELVVTIEDGNDIAEDILGIYDPTGSGAQIRARKTNLLAKGCFMSKNNPPTKQEITKAKSLLNKHLAKIVKEADDFDATNRASFINIKHYDAGHYLKVNKDWLKDITAQMDCPACGHSVPKNAVVHSPGCGAVLDEERYLQFHPELRYAKAQFELTQKQAKADVKKG